MSAEQRNEFIIMEERSAAAPRGFLDDGAWAPENSIACPLKSA
jgi:hypothetical protein